MSEQSTPTMDQLDAAVDLLDDYDARRGAYGWASYLQRRLSVRYGLALAILEELERRRIIERQGLARHFCRQNSPQVTYGPPTP